MKKILYIALAFAALFAVSCQKEKELHPVGSKIVFSASTEFKNGLETRTIYTGDYTQTSPDFERIQWVADDPIKILYKHDSGSPDANYTVIGTSISGSNHAKKSTASINASGTALEWVGGSTHKFYGLYPSTAGTLTAGSVTGLSIPATQTVTWNATQSKYLPTMTNAYMVAYKDMSSDPTGTVALPFTPVVNAVEFRLKLPDTNPSYTVSQVQLSHGTTAIAGSFNVSITGFANDAVTWSASSNSTTKKILVNFSDGSATAHPAVPTSTSGNVLDFTILTLPVSIYEPILEIKYSDGHVLKLTLSGLTLQPGQKCIVTNSKAGHDDFTYEVTSPSNQTITGHDAASFTQINVASLKRSGADNTHTEPVAWKVQYYDDSTVPGTWRDGVPSTHNISEDHTYNRFTVSLAAANTSTEYDNNKTPFAAATEILRARSSVGSSSAPYDLSTHALDGSTIAQTTANCYVVTRPGVYKFPLIYGNALLLGDNNPSAYSPKDVSAIRSAWGSQGTDATQNYYLPAFYNAKGQAITSPYLITDLGLTYSDIHVHRLTQISPDNNMISSFAKGGTNATDAYITFTITPENIRPGNIVFNAAYSSFSQEPDFDVAWSWHIWVTDKDLTPSNSIMPYNLGWVDKDEIVTDAVCKYTDRTVTLRIVQYKTTTENNQTVTTVLNEGTSFTLTQTGDVASINNPLGGTNPHYQWGRKDPYPYSSSIELQQHADAGESTGYWYWRGVRVAWKMLKSAISTTFLDGKAVPLYKAVQTPNSWTIKTGTYGPYGAGALKDAVQGILGTSNREERKRVTGNYDSWFCADLKNDSPNYGIPASYWSTTTTSQTANGFTWYAYKFKTGTILTSAQMTTLNNLCNYYNTGTVYLSLWDWNNYPTFEGAAIENVYYYRVTSPTTITEAQYNNLISKGFPSSGIEIGYATSYSHTTDPERALGSILHNLWNAALYNENASVSKYKTVYDPCPAGFTVPTKATYSSGTFTGYPRTGWRENSGGTSASTSVTYNTGNGAKGYYWTDHSCNMTYSSGNKDVITSYTDYDKAYILETTSSTASVKKNIRASAASIRPMTDPRATSIAGHATPAQVSASNPIESVTMGAEL